jgi:hypothetical protein
MTHDQNFNKLILDDPRQALEFFAAAEAAGIDLAARVTPVRQEQLQERPNGGATVKSTWWPARKRRRSWAC